MRKLDYKFFFYLSNALSLSRAPLAFLFFYENPILRSISVLLAMFTDSIDGYLARKANSTSKFGAIIDPLMDKFFVYFVVSIFFLEGKISILSWLAFTSRDISIFIFGSYLVSISYLKDYEIKSIVLGKISTALQFIFLILLSINYKIPNIYYTIFIPLALTAFLELIIQHRKCRIR